MTKTVRICQSKFDFEVDDNATKDEISAKAFETLMKYMSWYVEDVDTEEYYGS